MAKSKSKSLPRFKSLDELVEFFDTHDMGEYWDQMPEAHFDVDIKTRRHFFAIDADLADKVTQIARVNQTPSEVLINYWLKEKITELVKSSEALITGT
jgi:hypothetical protein